LKHRWSRTAVAAVLTAAGVIVPCSAWYIAGSHAAREQASRLEETPRQQARQEAERLAQQVAMRIESLRESESRRPFQDYLGDDELLQGDCTYETAIGSPLAEGPVDPLIWAHFQIDDVGVVTLPTLADPQSSARAGADTDSVQQAILGELECASSEHIAALRRTTEGGRRRQMPSSQGVVTVGSFSWHAASIEDGPALLALREVATPAVVLTQGFVVPITRLDALLAGSLHPGQILPGLPNEPADARIPIQGDAWTVRVDASRALSTAQAEGTRVKSRIRVTFFAGALAAMIAGCALVLLVRQTDRTARERARFAASAAHELRTPLAGLRLYGEMLADGSGDPARQTTYARRVADEAERLGRVVANVLGYSRLQRGGLRVHTRTGDLAPTIRASLDRLGPAFDSAGVPIELEVERDVPEAHFDPDAVHQILQNLLDNAAKFNREAEDRTVRVNLFARQTHPTLEVVDHGRGVDPALHRKLFRPFVHHPDPDAPAGLGIGLALVRALARAQGAEVSHRKPPEGGAAFAVRFRAAV
jgi:signal transduction histidine kinase